MCFRLTGCFLAGLIIQAMQLILTYQNETADGLWVGSCFLANVVDVPFECVRKVLFHKHRRVQFTLESGVGSSLVISTFIYIANHINHLQYQNTYSGAN